MSASRWEAYAALELRLAPGWEIETLVDPAPFYGVNGVRVGPDGECWVAQHRAGTLSSWAPDTGDTTVRSPIGGGITSPDDIAFGADGTVYVSELGDGCVRSMTPDGTYLTVYEDSPRANGITMDAGGRLFVSEFRPDGRIIEVFPAEPGRVRVIVPELAFANAFERGPDGRLYYQDVLAGTLSSVDPDEGPVRVELRDLQMPSSVKFDPCGRVVVAESAPGTITAFDLVRGDRAVLATVPPGIDNFCFDRQGRIHVSRNSTGQLVRFAAGEDRIDRCTAPGLTGPQDLAERADGTLLVADILSVLSLADRQLVPAWQLQLPEHPFTTVGVAEVAGVLMLLAGTGDVFRYDGRSSAARVFAAGASGTEYYLRAPGAAEVIERLDQRALLGCADGRLVELDVDGSVRAERPSGLERVDALSCLGSQIAACDRSAQAAILTGLSGTVRIGDLGAVADVALGPEGLYVARSPDGTIALRPGSGSSETAIARGLPFGLPDGTAPHERRPALIRCSDGSLVVGCDGDGSVRRLRRG